MIKLTRILDGERVPGITCDACGALLAFHTSLAVGDVLTDADHEAMRESAERMGWTHILPIGQPERDLCSRCSTA
jgi:hypothetical protein